LNLPARFCAPLSSALGVPSETPARLARALARRGYNAEREALTLLAGAPDPDAALETAVEAAPDDALVLTAAHVDDALSGMGKAARHGRPGAETGSHTDERATDAATTDDTPTPAETDADARSSPPADPSVSTGTSTPDPADVSRGSPVETKGSSERDPPPAEVSGDVTGRSTGTGEYDQFVRTFRDRYERLSGQLRSRVNARPASAVAEMGGGSETGLIGLVNDVRSTAGGHWLVELEDATGVFPTLVTKDRDLADLVDLLLLDECIAVEGRLSDDAGVLFADSLHFPEVPRTFRPSTADREVAAALVSDVHVGSEEFRGDAWDRFADWLHTPEAEHVEYLLIAGDMVEGVGVYPGQDDELDVVDIYEQYEAFAERLKGVPGDMEIVMIPGNHDAVRLAEPQPGFDEELREIMSAHDARIVGNPATVTVEGVSVLMYHGMSLDEVIAELPDERASYDEPHRAMYELLRKRHVAPQYGGKNRLAPEERDYLVMDEVPDVFHTGHVHKLGYGKYHNVLAINSGCWQAQTAFQKSVNIDPDVGYAPILRLDTHELTVRDFAP
jgi:DNA polymerase II small subunit